MDIVNYIHKGRHNNNKMYILLERYNNAKFVFSLRL